MDVVVSSRQCEVSERFREHVADKLARLEKHDHRIIRVEVVLERERNPRQAERQVRIELTAKEYALLEFLDYPRHDEEQHERDDEEVERYAEQIAPLEDDVVLGRGAVT